MLPTNISALLLSESNFVNVPLSESPETWTRSPVDNRSITFSSVLGFGIFISCSSLWIMSISLSTDCEDSLFPCLAHERADSARDNKF